MVHRGERFIFSRDVKHDHLANRQEALEMSCFSELEVNHERKPA